MEKHTDRILWSIFVLAIGISLFVFGKPAFTNIIHGSTQQLSYSTKDVDSSSNSDFSYSEPNTTDHTISIVGYSGHKENLTIPQYRKIGSVYYKITAIGASAFSRNGNIKQVTIPDGLTSIGNYAFEYTKLTSVDLPASLTSIGFSAFYNTPLTSVHLPASLTSISSWAFADTKLTSVDFPVGLTSINSDAFRDTPLTSVHLPAGLTSIGIDAFRDTKLISVDFPASLTSIGHWAFDSTPISTISFKKRVDLDYESFTNTNLKNVTLPAGSTYKKTPGSYGKNQTFDPGVIVTIK